MLFGISEDRAETSRASMMDTKPTISWAFGSLGCSILGCLAALAMFVAALHMHDVDPTGVSGGLAVFCLGGLSSTLCLLGVIFGVVALRRIRSGEWGGRGKAWTGLAIGCVLLAVLLAIIAPHLWETLWDEMGSQIRGRNPKT